MICAGIDNPRKPRIRTLGELLPAPRGFAESPQPLPWYSQIAPPLELIDETRGWHAVCREIDMLEVMDSVVVSFYVRFAVEELEELEGADLLVWVLDPDPGPA